MENCEHLIDDVCLACRIKIIGNDLRHRVDDELNEAVENLNEQE